MMESRACVMRDCDPRDSRKHRTDFGSLRLGQRWREREKKIVIAMFLQECGSSQHFGQIKADFLRAAAGKQAYPLLVRVQTVGRIEAAFASEVFARHRGRRQIGERMANI